MNLSEASHHHSIPETFHAKQAQLQCALDVNNSECLEVKRALNNLVSAVLSPSPKNKAATVESDDDSTSTASSNMSIDTVFDRFDNSLASIDEIDTATDDTATDDESTNETKREDISSLQQLITLISEGKIEISKEVFHQILDLQIKINAICETSSIIQERMVSLKSDFENYKKELVKLQQYIKLDNLLFHNFRLPHYKNLSSMEFSHYMAEQINFLLPQLSVPVSWLNISDAHPLRTKSKKSTVIIVRFCNRNIRHEIYSKRELLKKYNITVTEHLTPENLKSLKRAQELFGQKNVYTENCNIVITSNGKTTKVRSIEEINELFENAHAHHVSQSNNSPGQVQTNVLTNESNPASSTTPNNSRKSTHLNSKHSNVNTHHKAPIHHDHRRKSANTNYNINRQRRSFPYPQSYARSMQNWNNSNNDYDSRSYSMAVQNWNNPHNDNYNNIASNNHYHYNNYSKQPIHKPPPRRFGGYRGRNPPYSVYNR